MNGGLMDAIPKTSEWYDSMTLFHFIDLQMTHLRLE